MVDSGGSSSSTVGAVVGTLLGGSSTSSNPSVLQRTAGTTATLGFSYFLLRFVVKAAKTIADEDNNYITDARTRETVADLLGKSEALYVFVRNLLRRFIIQQGFLRLHEGLNDGLDEEECSEEDNVPMIHKGSCHCRAVCFELIAPQRIVCNESKNGKIGYRHARIRAKSFRFVKGANLVSMYYVNKVSKQSSDSEVGAHSFCSRCGVHFLHAPNSRSNALDVNVDCLNQMDAKIKSSRKKVDLSAGISVEDQWEDQDNNNIRYPATIAEEKSSMTPFNHSSPFAAYRNHPVMRGSAQYDWDRLDSDADDGTISLTFPGSKNVPGTPTTVYTNQDSNLSSSGVPPTLTLDTRSFANDSESVVSLSSVRSGYPPMPPTSTSARSSAFENAFIGMNSPPSHAGIAPSTTPLVRHHLNTYLKKHMSSSSGSTISSAASPTAASNTTTPTAY